MAGNPCERIDQWLISSVKGRSHIKGGGGVTCSLRRFSLGFRVHKLGPVAREFRDLRALVPEEDPGGPRA